MTTSTTTVEPTTMTVLEATNAAMAWEMAHDDSVLLLGEDVGTAGGIFRTSQNLQQQFGKQRVIDTPLDEKGIVAHSTGLALNGMRPIVEIQFSGFIHDAFEHIMYCATKYRWLTGGAYTCPMVIRAPSYGGIKGGFWHSQSPEAHYMHGGGLKVLAPSTPQDAYSLLLAAIRDPDPVLVLEAVPLYRALSGEVVADGTAATIGEAEIVHPGDSVTVLTWGPLRYDCVDVAQQFDPGTVEVIDLRSLLPFDIDTISESVRKTGRMVVVHEASETLGFGAELVARVQEEVFGYLHAPIKRVAAPDLPYGFAIGDEHYRPDAARIRQAITQLMEFRF